MDPLIGQTINEKFVIHRLLGEGGMGKVYAGEQLGIGRKVAIKVLQDNLSKIPEVAMRFEREAKAAGRVVHPNSVTIFDFGHDPQGRLYLAMEYLEGEPLSARCKREPRFPVVSAVHIISQVLETLEACHAVGIVHRDLKPDNIFLCNQKGQEAIKILDYGIARLSDSPEVTKTGQLIGTPFYMSPEQATGKKVSPATDLYSVGIIFFQLLTGCPPYIDKSSLDVFRKHLHAPIPSLEQSAPDRAELLCFEPIIKKALAKKPEDRFQSAKELRVLIQKAAFDLRNGKLGSLWTTPPAPLPATQKQAAQGRSDTHDEFGNQATQGLMDENGDQVATFADERGSTLELSQTMAEKANLLEETPVDTPQIGEGDATLAMAKISLPTAENPSSTALATEVAPDTSKAQTKDPSSSASQRATKLPDIAPKSIVPLGEMFRTKPLPAALQTTKEPEAQADESLPFFTTPSQPKLAIQSKPLPQRLAHAKWPLYGAILFLVFAAAVFFWPPSKPSSLLVQTVPAGAKILVNNAERPGTSPMKLELPVGTVTIEVQKVGCTPLKQSLQIEADTSQIILALKCP